MLLVREGTKQLASVKQAFFLVMINSHSNFTKRIMMLGWNGGPKVHYGEKGM
jgi:hypothetical protein